MRSIVCVSMLALSACVPVFRYADGEDAASADRVVIDDQVDDRSSIEQDVPSIDAVVLDAPRDAIVPIDVMVSRPDVQADVIASDAGAPGAPLQTLCAGDAFSCAIVSDRVYCWGRNDATQTGSVNNGTGRCTDTNNACPVRVVSRLDSVVARQVVCGERFACMLSGSNEVYCWGSNAFRQLGPMATGAAAGATLVGTFPNTQRITAGARHACIVSGFTVSCWGDNSAGQLGLLSTTLPLSATPVAVEGIPVGARAIEIRGGGLHTIARLDDGRIVAWGSDSYGQMSHGLGSEARGAVVLPATVTGGGTAVALAASWAQSCIATASGTLCGGSNLAGEIGSGLVDGSLRYNRMGAVSAASGSLTLLAAGGKDFATPMSIRQHVCGIAGTQLVCWGNNSRAQLGPVPTTGTTSPFPAQVLHTFSGALNGVAAGAAHTCVRAGAGVYCWGSNGSDESVNSADNTVTAGTTVTVPTRVRIP